MKDSGIVFTNVQKFLQIGIEEIAQQLRALFDLVEEPGLVPSTRIWQLTTSHSWEGSDIVF